MTATFTPSIPQADRLSWVPDHLDLTPTALAELGRELDAVYDEVYSNLGDADEKYVRRLIRIQRSMAFGSRMVMFSSLAFRRKGKDTSPAENRIGLGMLGVGSVALGVSKILENMEIGHNIMHGQWDWMQDPDINSTVWEWDNVCPSDQWKHGHNVVHHTWTNVLGKDRDIGYEIFRMDDRQDWRPFYVAQPFYNVLLMLLFEWGVGVHEVDIEGLANGELDREATLGELAKLRQFAKKAARQGAKDYLLWPSLAVTNAPTIAKANIAANLIRNIWTYVIIFCGHFPEGTHVFEKDDVEGETRAEWYLRQILASANIEGSPLFNVMSGQLSHQIEHHLFPDMPSNHLPKIAPRVEGLCRRYGIPYNNDRLGRQFGTTIRKIVHYARPSVGRETTAAQ